MEILQTRVPKYQGGITANEQAGNYSSIKFSAFDYAWLEYKGWSIEKRRRNAIHIQNFSITSRRVKIDQKKSNQFITILSHGATVT